MATWRCGNEVDWTRMIALASAHCVNVRLRMGMIYLAEQFGASVPSYFLQRLRGARVSPFERFENRILLSDDVSPSVLANQLRWMAHFLRRAKGANPWSLAVDYTHYARYRLGVDRRRQIP